MCGIVGYVGKRNVEKTLISGLETLEYRGYDSSGVALLDNNIIKIIKSVGKIASLKEKLSSYKLDSVKMGIAHTRWATHGAVSELNSHPHHIGKVTLVHNGIIENYKEIEKLLIKKGYIFKTDTDTERMAALIDLYYIGDNQIEAIDKAIHEVRGSYALAIMFDDDKDNIYGVRKDAPLIMGVGDKEGFIASDISAILAYTKKYVILDDNEIVKLNENPEIYYDGVIINKKVLTASWNLEDAQKQGYEHFMLKEINEQPALSKKLYSKYLDGYDFNDDVVDLTKYSRIDFVACGSAYHASLIGKHLADKYILSNDFYVTCDVASEYRYKNHYYDKKTLVVVLSQSGETADTLACLRMANEQNVDTLAIVNVVSSSIAREAKMVMPMLAGPEICVATTKGYFSQVYIVSLLLLKLIYKKRIINKQEKDKILDDFKDISKCVKKVIDNNTYSSIAKSIYKEEDIYYIGRGVDSYICYEGSLKLKEISYIHSECFMAGELKHGPIALISKNTPLIALLTEDSVAEKTISNTVESSSRGAKVIVISKDLIKVDDSVYDYNIKVPSKSDFVEPLIVIVACQILAYEVAKLRKCDIDKPRNLAKSVTVE